MKKRKVYETKNLISGEVNADYLERKRIEEEHEIKNEDRIIGYLRQNVTMNIITDQSVFKKGSIPPPLLPGIC